MAAQRSDGKYFEVETDDELTFFIFQPAYKEIVCADSCYIRNKLTGENCGQHLILCKHVNNLDGTINENPVYDPDIYDIVPKDKR